MYQDDYDLPELSNHARETLVAIERLRMEIESLKEESLAARRRELNLYEALSSQEPVLLVNYSMTYDGATKENVLVRDKKVIEEFEKTRDLSYLERVISPIVKKDPEDIIVFGMVMVNTH